MLLVIDVGNTNITLGIFDGEKVSGTFRMKSKQPRTSDEYGIMLRELVERHGVAGKDIQDVIIASVVPDVMHSLGSAIIKYFGVKPMVVSAGIKTGIRIVTENPRQVGADRIVDAVAAYTLFGGPVIVVDFGTATTYDIIGPDGTFEAGVIAPGIRTSAQALWGEADMLPAIEIRKASLNPCKRDHFQHAGRAPVRTDWADRVHCKTVKRRIRLQGCQSSSHRRTWKNDRIRHRSDRCV